MPELIAKANQVILEAQLLRREGRALRFEASVWASELGRTILRAHRTQSQGCETKMASIAHQSET